jgi:predicted membrane protein
MACNALVTGVAERVFCACNVLITGVAVRPRVAIKAALFAPAVLVAEVDKDTLFG